MWQVPPAPSICPCLPHSFWVAEHLSFSLTALLYPLVGWRGRSGHQRDALLLQLWASSPRLCSSRGGGRVCSLPSNHRSFAQALIYLISTCFLFMTFEALQGIYMLPPPSKSSHSHGIGITQVIALNTEQE